MSPIASGSSSARWIPTRVRDPFAPEPWAVGTARLAPDLERDPAQLETFASAHLEGDALADELVALLANDANGAHRSALEQALTQGIASVEAPAPALSAFFREVERVPAWLDRTLIRRAGALYHRTFWGAQRVLFSASLLAGYASAGIVKPLVGTGALERMAVRRLAETQKFVTDLYGRGQLARSSAGFQGTLRVRIMHARVRRQLLARGFDVARWGVPINQADLAATVLQFSITYLLGLRALGFHVSAREADAVLHLWRYTGRLLGVRDDLLPRTEGEARAQLRLSAASQSGPDEDSRKLARALLGIPDQLGLSSWRLELARRDYAFRGRFARSVLGKPAADALGLPGGPLELARYAVFPAVFVAECVRRTVPFGTRTLTWLGRRHAERTAEMDLGARPSS
jgi:hypothetical protein